MALNSSTTTVGATATASQYNNARKDIVQFGGDYAVTTGSANAYAITVDSQFVLTAGVKVKGKLNFSNTGATTLNVNSGGAVAIKIFGTSDTVTGDMLSGQIVEWIYDGTYWQMLTPSAQARQSYLTKVFTFGENVDGTTTPQALYLKASDSKVWKTVDSGTESTYKFIGFTRDNVAANATGNVITDGEVAGFTGLTSDSDYLLNGTGTISLTAGSNVFKVARASSTTTIRIERGVKMMSGINAGDFTAAGSGTNNNDATIDLGFRPKIIEIQYYLQGHGAASGTAKYEFKAGIATYIETTIISNFEIANIVGGSGGNTTDSDQAVIKDMAIQNTNITSPGAPAAGTTSGTGAISMEISIPSISDTGFVLRRKTTTSTAVSNHARNNVRWKAIA